MAGSIRLSFILSELAAFRNQARYTVMKIKPAPAQMSLRTQFIRVNNNNNNNNNHHNHNHNHNNHNHNHNNNLYRELTSFTKSDIQ